MNKNTVFPYSFEVYCKEHPEKFETRINSTKRMIYGIGAAISALLVFFPSITDPIPILCLLPLWLIVGAGIIGALVCLLMAFFDCDHLHNIQSNGVIKPVGHKKFDRVNAKRDEVFDAFARHDFDFLADAAETNNDPLQIFIHEDALGKELYLQLREYTTPSEFHGASDVLTVSGNEYDQFRSTILSIGPIKK